MVGCGLIWGACVLGVIALLKHRRHGFGGGCYGGRGWGGHGGYANGWGGHGDGWDGPEEYGAAEGPPRGGFRGYGLRRMVRRLFERLGTTPGQEKAIVGALEDVRAAMGNARGEMKTTRKDFADAFRRGPIDEAAVADIFVRHDTVISETRRKVVEAMGRVHEALDDEQRATVADVLEKGPGFGGGRRGRFGAPWRGRSGYGYRW